MMVLGRDAAAALGLLTLLAAPASSFPTSRPASIACPRRDSSLGNMLREYADFSDPSWDPANRSFRSGATSSNWRKNQGYNLSKPTPPEMGGSFSPLRDAETNPYYDPGWAQSIRRDNPVENYNSASSYNGYNDPYNYERFGGSRSYRYPSTYPGMTSPRRTDKVYTNPTNPYYDPVWSQSYARREDPIRDYDHTLYYAEGYDRRFPYYDDMAGGYGGYGNGMGPGRRMFAVPQKGKKTAVLNGNSLMR